MQKYFVYEFYIYLEKSRVIENIKNKLPVVHKVNLKLSQIRTYDKNSDKDGELTK